MLLAAGDKLGPYEIISLIGKGGMGEVYSAHDPRTGRDVAIKVSAERFNERFDREVRAVAALNHPNICTLFDVGPNYLVMELVEGESPQGPLPLDTAMNYARQIVAALEEAHEKGVVHRDLKPGNIKIKPDGTVKVLDFGLAKMGGTPAAPSENSPTISMAATQAGMILGTAAYMAPEQAKGKPVDKRADIWAFGVVLHEMLTGERLFEHDDLTETLAAVVMKAPELERAPVEVRRLLKKCLEKDPKKRLRDIGDAWELLENETPHSLAAVPLPAGARWLWPSIAGLVTLVLAALAFVHFRETPPSEPTLRYTIALPENATMQSFALSPDGRSLVIAATANGKQQLWLRPLEALQAQPMPTTEGASYPFWSPDSRYIGFFAQGKLKKIAASGGPAQSLCDANNSRGGSWNREDVILFSPDFGTNGIHRVPAAGGVPSRVITSESRFPLFLSDDRHFVYLVQQTSPEKNGIYIGSLDGKENRRVLTDVSSAVFAPPAAGRVGHLLFIRDNNLMAQPFDAGSAQLAGDVFPVADSVALVQSNLAPVVASEDRMLLYWSGGGGSVIGGNNQIVWYDRAGKLLSTEAAQGAVLHPALSPDEKTIAFQRFSGGAGADIWLRDLVRKNDQRLTSDPSQNGTPFWSPNGDRIVFRSNRGGHLNDLYLRAVNGSGQDEALLSSFGGKVVDQWSRDGRFIVYSDQDAKTKNDLWVLPMGEGGASSGNPADRKPAVFLHSEFNEMHGQISPDAHWMAYTSDESGRREVYVRPFPASAGIWKISLAGGAQPRWRGDGKELFYLAADGKLTAVAVKALAGPKPTFNAGTPGVLFDPHISNPESVYFDYDVAKDGKRFLVSNVAAAAAAATAVSTPPLTVVVNWNAGSKK